MNFVMKRILKVEKKNRITTTVRIEKELLEILHKENFNISDVVNTALEKHLREKGLLK